MVVAAAVVPTGSAAANGAGTSGWEVEHGTDRITESMVWYAFSRTVRPESATSPTLRRLKSRIEVECSADSEWVGGALSEKAQLQGSQSMLFGEKRFAEMRTRWNNTPVTMTFDYVPGSRYLRFQEHDVVLEWLKSAETLLIELRWANDEWVYFRFSLSGSRDAIEQVWRECEALPERRVEARRIEAEKKKAEPERKRIEAEKEKAEAERKRIEAEKRKAEAERKRIEAARRREAERALQEQIAREDQQLEKERLAVLDSGRIDYIAQIKDKIERSWLRPPGTASGLKCVVRVSQIPGGEVVQAEIQESSGNIAFDRSVEEAVLRSSPLPVPKDPSLFDRHIVITFEPDA